jgi:hypothetical protein
VTDMLHRLGVSQSEHLSLRNVGVTGRDGCRDWTPSLIRRPGPGSKCHVQLAFDCVLICINEQNEAFIVSLALLQHCHQIVPKFGTRVNIRTAILHL